MTPPLNVAARFGIQYRALTASDLAFIEVLYGFTRADGLALRGWPEDQRLSFLHQQNRAQHYYYQTYYPGAEWLIIERGGEPVGRLYLVEWADQIRVIDLSLMPADRGQGIGGAILRDTCERAEALRKRVSIHVEKNNAARHLYLRLGFAIVEDKGIYDLMEWGNDTAG